MSRPPQIDVDHGGRLVPRYAPRFRLWRHPAIGCNRGGHHFNRHIRLAQPAARRTATALHLEVLEADRPRAVRARSKVLLASRLRADATSLRGAERVRLAIHVARRPMLLTGRGPALVHER